MPVLWPDPETTESNIDAGAAIGMMRALDMGGRWCLVFDTASTIRSRESAADEKMEEHGAPQLTSGFFRNDEGLIDESRSAVL
jgi:hypothetical protein